MIRLPTFTFLNGPNGSGKTSLAMALCASDPGLCHMSFAEPIRMALLATFHPDAIFDGEIDLRQQRTKDAIIPGTNRSYRHWMMAFGTWMRTAEFNPYIFADIARQRCDRLLPHWPRFIFDDCRFAEEPAPFSLAYGSTNCLVISLDRTGTSWGKDSFGASLIRLPGVSHAALSNNRSIDDMLTVLESVLGTFGPSTHLRQPTLEPSAEVHQL